MKKSMKWLALVLCVAIVAVTLVSCGGNTNKVDEDKVFNVGICQFVQHVALDAATEGFKQALIDKIGEDHVNFDYQDASNEVTNCTTIINKFVSDEVDLIMANATPPLQAAAEATSTIPVVGTSITDYADALKISDWNGKTGINVTGASDLAPLDQQAAMFKELLPEAKKIGILYCSAESNSKFQAEGITEALKELGYEVKHFTFVDTNDVISVTQQLVSECDAMYIPTDNTAASNTGAINNVVEPENFPVIAAEEGICKGCGFATLSINYFDVGYKSGEMAAEILLNGADPAEMEIGYIDVTKEYIADRAEALGLTIPEDYVAIEAE